MSAESYRKFLRVVYGLYREEKYVEVIDFQKEVLGKYPDMLASVEYTSMCAAAKMEKSDLALEIFSRVLDGGGWYSEYILKQSPALAPLQDLPDFKKLLVTSVKIAKQNEKERNLTVIPNKYSSPYPLILALHSNGGFIEEEFNPWKEFTNRGYFLGMPRSNALCWSSKDSPEWTDDEETADHIKTFVNNLVTNETIDPKSIITGGLSYGGGMAIKMALTGTIPARKFIAIAPGGHWNEPEELVPLFDDANKRSLKGIIIHGTKDEVIPIDKSQKLASMLTDGGIPTKFIEWPDLEHCYPPGFAGKLSSFVTGIDKD